MDLTVVRTDMALGGLLIEGGLQFVDGVLETVPCRRTALMSCTGVPIAAEGRDPQHVGVVEIEHALVGIFGEQRIEHGAGLRPVFREHVALLDILGPLAAGERLAGRRRRGR